MTDSMRKMAVRFIPCLAVMACAPPQADAWQEPGSSSSAKAAVALHPGESHDILLCWDEGTGRVPAVFISDAASLPETKKKSMPGEPRLERAGLTLTYNEERTADIQAAFYEDGQLAGKQPDGPFKHLTAAAVRVMASHDAVAGVHPFFIHVVSGTGRSMLLVGELRVVVLD